MVLQPNGPPIFLTQPAWTTRTKVCPPTSPNESQSTTPQGRISSSMTWPGMLGPTSLAQKPIKDARCKTQGFLSLGGRACPVHGPFEIQAPLSHHWLTWRGQPSCRAPEGGSERSSLRPDSPHPPTSELKPSPGRVDEGVAQPLLATGPGPEEGVLAQTYGFASLRC